MVWRGSSRGSASAVVVLVVVVVSLAEVDRGRLMVARVTVTEKICCVYFV